MFYNIASSKGSLRAQSNDLGWWGQIWPTGHRLLILGVDIIEVYDLIPIFPLCKENISLVLMVLLHILHQKLIFYIKGSEKIRWCYIMNLACCSLGTTESPNPKPNTPSRMQPQRSPKVKKKKFPYLGEASVAASYTRCCNVG